jgi:hypothetical protein
MRKTSRWTPRAGRWACIALVLAFLGRTFAAGTHWLTVPHHLCEVHNTIEHGVASAADPRSAGPIFRETERPHDECAFGPFARTEVVPLAQVERRGVFVAEERGRVFLPTAPAASVPLLLLAPSRSPPE